MPSIKKIKKTIQKEITLIDLILIIFGILIVGFLLFHFRRKREFIYIDITFQRQDWNEESFPPEYWEIINLETGDIGYNSVGKEVIEIQEIEKNVWGGGERLFIEVVVKIDSSPSTSTRTYVFDGNPLLVGEKMNLKFNNTSLTGIIANVYKNKEQRFDNYQRADAEIKVHYHNLDPWHAEAINGINITNSQGENILITKDVKITPAEKVVVTDKGEVLLRWNPIKKDLIVTFELPNILCSAKSCFYNHYQTLMVGETFWADSGKTYIDGGSIMSSTIKYKD